ncbi:MAG: HAD family hydrolase [Clostridiales bacterium]|nr:HAD family hydrolase [Clostridiales bacterium]
MIKAIIFDLDGTLINTLEDLCDSVNHVLALHGMPLHSLGEIRRFVGNGIGKLIERSVPESTDKNLVSICTAEMLDWYKDHAKIKTAPYEGVKELIEYLNKNGIKTAVVTNKAEAAAKALCNEIFGDVFTCVIGDDGKTPLKPAPDNVFRALNAVGADRETALYVGDSEVDMITARNSGLDSIGVLWGFRDEETLKNNGAKYIVSSPSDIKKLI